MKKLILISIILLLSQFIFGQTKKELVQAKKAEIQVLKDSITSKTKQLNILKKNLDFDEVGTDTLTNKKAVISRGKSGTNIVWYLTKGSNSYKINLITIVLRMDSINYYFNLRNDSLITTSSIDNTVLFTIP